MPVSRSKLSQTCNLPWPKSLECTIIIAGRLMIPLISVSDKLWQLNILSTPLQVPILGETLVVQIKRNAYAQDDKS